MAENAEQQKIHEKVFIEERNGYAVIHFPNPCKPFDAQKFKEKTGVDPDHPTVIKYESYTECPFVKDDGTGIAEGIDAAALYFENGKCKYDKDWSKQIMTPRVLKKKALAEKRTALEEELAKPSPDAILATQLQLEIEKLRKKDQNDFEFWAQHALDGLDQRVAKGKADKQVVRQKLQAKLAQIQAAKGGNP